MLELIRLCVSIHNLHLNHVEFISNHDEIFFIFALNENKSSLSQHKT